MEDLGNGVKRDGVCYFIWGSGNDPNVRIKITPNNIQGDGFIRVDQLQTIVDAESGPPKKKATAKVEVIGSVSQNVIPADKVDEFLQASDEEIKRREENGNSNAGDTKPVRTAKKRASNSKSRSAGKVSKPNGEGGE